MPNVGSWGQGHILLVHFLPSVPKTVTAWHKINAKLRQEVFIEQLWRESTARCWGPRMFAYIGLCSGWKNWLLYHLGAVLLNFFIKELRTEENTGKLFASWSLCSCAISVFPLLCWAVCHQLINTAPSFCSVLCIAESETTFPRLSFAFWF